MLPFNIVPPRVALIGPEGRITPEWYRFLLALFQALGNGVTMFTVDEAESLSFVARGTNTSGIEQPLRELAATLGLQRSERAAIEGLLRRVADLEGGLLAIRPPSAVQVAAAAAGGTPGGSTTQVQFNDAGAFGGDADFVWDKTNNILVIGAVATPGGIKGAPGSASAGGALNLTGGAGAGGTNAGGAVSLTGGVGVGAGGAATVQGGQGNGSNAGGAVSILGGSSNNGSGSGNGGNVSITAGANGSLAGGVAGTVSVTGGTGFAGATGGSVTVQGGSTTLGNGGGVSIIGSAGGGSNHDGGHVLIQAGASSGGTGNGGNIKLDAGRGAAIATSATGGFVTIPTCAGTPTGTPANVPTGSVPLVYDTTNRVLWIYTGSVWLPESNGIPQNSQSADYTLVASDAGKHIYHPSADTTARTFTIPANASVAYPIGTALTFINDTSAGVVTIAITTDTLVFAGTGGTGSRTLAANGSATAVKITSTRWMISGSGLT